MRVCTVATDKYEADLGQLMKRRLELSGYSGEARYQRRRVDADIADAEALRSWCAAVSELIALDLAQFEIAYMVNEFPIPMEEKKLILKEGIRGLSGLDRSGVASKIAEYFSESDCLSLEGFVTFRMKDSVHEWERVVLRAADELMLNAEYVELMQVLSALLRLRSPGRGEIFVVLNPDGSCTFTDDGEVRIDYERCTGDGIMSVLVGLAPERITVYDLSGGRSAGIAGDLIRIFDGRVKFYSKP